MLPAGVAGASPGSGPAFRSTGLHGAVWLAFAAGGAVGSLAKAHWGFAVLALPLGCLVAMIVWDVARPLHATSGIEEKARRP